MIPIWPKVPLKTIYKGFYDGPHATPAESDEGAIFLGIKNVTESGRLDLSEIRYIAEAELGKWTKRVIPQKDDIVFSYEATLHRYARIPEGFRGCLGRRMALIRVNPDIANVDFVFCYFLGPVWRCEVEKNILTGATVDRIPLTKVPDFAFFLPPLVVQQKIASILSAYDGLIEYNLKRIKLLEEMAKITYEEWFVRLKFPGHETTPMDSKTGLPVGWKKEYLGNLTSYINRGISPDYVENDGVRVINQKCIRDNFVNFDEARLTSKESKIQEDKMIKKFDILINSTGTGTLGRVAQIFKVPEFATVDTHVTIVRVSGAISSLYLGRALEHIEKFIENLGKGATNQQELSRTDLAKTIKIVVPTIELQDKYDEIAAPIYESISIYRSQNQLLKEARDILLPRLMTGMIDVEQLVLPEPFSNTPSSPAQEPQTA